MSQANGICAVVPFKSLRHAKQRLANYLTSEQRSQLVAAMLEDTLRALLATDGLERILLVSNDSFAEQLAQRLGIDYQAECAQSSGLNSVLQAVGDELTRQDYTSMLIVHGDLPMLTANEAQQLIGLHLALNNRKKISLVPDRARDGSNCLICTPPNILHFSYGRGSCEKHLAIAAQGNIQSEIVELPGASLDIDEPQDLQQLIKSPQLHSANCTQQVVRQLAFDGQRFEQRNP